MTVTGFVDDPSDLFATLDIAVAPLRLGSGVKIKVFETIDAGIPTVVTQVGGEGIPSHPLLDVAAGPDELVDLIVTRLGAPPFCSRTCGSGQVLSSA